MGCREELAILETEYLIAYMYEIDFEDVKTLFEEVGLPDYIRACPYPFTYSYDKAANEVKDYLDYEGITLPKKKNSSSKYMNSDKYVYVSISRKKYEKGICYPETRFIVEKDHSITPLPTS